MLLYVHALKVKAAYRHVHSGPARDCGVADRRRRDASSAAPARVAPLGLAQVEESVDDWVHHGVRAGEDEERLLHALVHVLKRLLVDEEPAAKEKFDLIKSNE